MFLKRTIIGTKLQKILKIAFQYAQGAAFHKKASQKHSSQLFISYIACSINIFNDLLGTLIQHKRIA